MSNFLKDALDKLSEHYDVAELVDETQIGLMKVHEFVGYASEMLAGKVADLGLDMQDGIMFVSEKLESMYYVDDAPKGKHFAEPGKVQDEVKADTHIVEGKPELKAGAMTREQLVDYLSTAYAIDKGNLRTVNESTMRRAVEADQERRNQNYNQ